MNQKDELEFDLKYLQSVLSTEKARAEDLAKKKQNEKRELSKKSAEREKDFMTKFQLMTKKNVHLEGLIEEADNTNSTLVSTMKFINKLEEDKENLRTNCNADQKELLQRYMNFQIQDVDTLKNSKSDVDNLALEENTLKQEIESLHRKNEAFEEQMKMKIDEKNRFIKTLKESIVMQLKTSQVLKESYDQKIETLNILKKSSALRDNEIEELHCKYNYLLKVEKSDKKQ